MPYHKNKQQAFQAAQQGHKQALDANAQANLVQGQSSYGQELKHVKEEVNEAYAQIENALEVASDSQHKQLTQFQQDLKGLVDSVNNEQ
ncbi:hypothetical protein [Priestia koreensis]|uniref:Small, acid-soluble spore protein N n=1 Tax=Priestia koreensis TaxID=284581 RepID=A0A0M0L907_9BACI|nr:hypothetical protein [Priestia koreensis]KOO47571.1 hypothetical protein AMD01_05895 [Priestia koreensis]MCM3006177.1 hypothetical protein [Priestia koreensis]UNL87235.1 hypothetical protein IE339_11350 [Priestia koreensis]